MVWREYALISATLYMSLQETPNDITGKLIKLLLISRRWFLNSEPSIFL